MSDDYPDRRFEALATAECIHEGCGMRIRNQKLHDSIFHQLKKFTETEVQKRREKRVDEGNATL